MRSEYENGQKRDWGQGSTGKEWISDAIVKTASDDWEG